MTALRGMFLMGRERAQIVDKAVKVFARLFQKAAQSRARSPRRRPQTAKPSYRRFLFAKLFLCAFMVKEKASFSIVLFGGLTPFVYSLRPHPSPKATDEGGRFLFLFFQFPVNLQKPLFDLLFPFVDLGGTDIIGCRRTVQLLLQCFQFGFQ